LFPLRKIFSAAFLTALLLFCGCKSPQKTAVRRGVLPLPELLDTALERTLDLRTLEELQRTNSEWENNGRLMELPAFAAEFRRMKKPVSLENDIRLRILEEAMDGVALQRLPGNRDPVEFYRPFVAKRMRCALSQRWSEYRMLTTLSAPAPQDTDRLRDLRLELALSLGCSASELPEVEEDSFPSPDQKVPPYTLPEELLKVYKNDSGAALRYAMMLFRLPAELQRRESLEPGFPAAHSVAAALYYGAAFRIAIAREHLTLAEEELRRARIARERDWLSSKAADAELRAVYAWRAAFFRYQYDTNCAPKGRGTPAERSWIIDFATLQQ